MTQSAQTAKLLVLYEILRQYSDEEQPISTTELLKRLQEKGFQTGRQALYHDIEVLIEYGYDIIKVKGNPNKYFLADRNFEIPELKILVDAVRAANFITPNKTAKLVDKLALLAGQYRAQILKETVVHYDTCKQTNESIYYHIDVIERAIQEKRQIEFLYFDYDHNGERVYRRDGQTYLGSPLTLVMDRGYYYLLINHAHHGESATTYRVDRMDEVRLLGDEVTPADERLQRRLSTIRDEAFMMYSGESTHVRLLFREEQMNAIMDRFGKPSLVVSHQPGYYEIKETIQVSKTFFSWLAGFEGKIQILSPKSVKEEFRAFLERNLQQL